MAAVTREQALRMVRICGGRLEDLPSDLRADTEVVAVAVQQDATAIQFADPVLRSVRELALDTVARDGMTLVHFPDYADDKSVVLEAVEQNGMALQYASRQLRSDYE
eukprot:Sspe_Gene.88383::Locus_60418_Transcript_1_1_Confidence_1.000_Length_357::g.88383::m.88383